MSFDHHEGFALLAGGQGAEQREKRDDKRTFHQAGRTLSAQRRHSTSNPADGMIPEGAPGISRLAIEATSRRMRPSGSSGISSGCPPPAKRRFWQQRSAWADRNRTPADAESRKCLPNRVQRAITATSRVIWIPARPASSGGNPRHQKAGDPDRQVEPAAPPDSRAAARRRKRDPHQKRNTCPIRHLIPEGPEAPEANVADSAPAAAKAAIATAKAAATNKAATAPMAAATAIAATVEEIAATAAHVHRAGNTSPCR